MHRLTDESPYQILGITPAANKAAVKNAFARKSAERVSSDQLRKIHQAYDTLRSPEERALVDALTPLLDQSETPEEVLVSLEELINSKPAITDCLDMAIIWSEDLHALVRAIIQSVCVPTAPAGPELPLLSDFDGLDKFVAELR